MKINFYLRPLSKKDRISKDMIRPIYMYISFASQRAPIDIGIECLESLWDNKKQRAKPKEGKEVAIKINIALQEWEEKAHEFEDKYKPANPKLLIRLLKGVEIRSEVNEKEFFRFFENYMNTSVPAGSIHNYRKCLVHLKSFSNQKYKVAWETLTAKFYQDYMRFLSEEYVNFRTGKKGILNSTITKDIWTLKDVSRYARKQGISVPVDVEDFEKPSNTETKRTSITEDRLNNLLKFDFTDWTLYSDKKRIRKILETKVIPNILRVRDIYTISFYTALAHKELMKITPDQIMKVIASAKEVSIIDFGRSKTRKLNSVPLNKVCLDILDKYKGGKTILPYFTNQQYNRICKRMFQIAGFNKKITLTRWSGDREITETFEEWELLTSHTGRHSAATNILKKTKNLTIARDLLGHKSVKTTEIYAKNDKETFYTAILDAIEKNETK